MMARFSGDADIPNQGLLSLLTRPSGSDRGTNELLVSRHCHGNSTSPWLTKFTVRAV